MEHSHLHQRHNPARCQPTWRCFLPADVLLHCRLLQRKQPPVALEQATRRGASHLWRQVLWPGPALLLVRRKHLQRLIWRAAGVAICGLSCAAGQQPGHISREAELLSGHVWWGVKQSSQVLWQLCMAGTHS